MSLKAELQEIDGVGEVTAEKILEVVEEHGESVDVETFKTGLEYYEEEQYGYAKKFFDRVL